MSPRAEALYRESMARNAATTSRMFAVLMAAQWAFAVLVSLAYSPYAWEGRSRSIHTHVVMAVVMGGLIASLPLALALTRPAATATRHVIACAQMLFSALLIHLTGGRIETHFHVFGSLAFLAFYRDWRVLVPATVVVASDHLLRGLYWPESVYGIVARDGWRFLEHAAWVAFEDIVLVLACLRASREAREIAVRQATIEALSERERAKTAELDSALVQVRDSQAAVLRSEKLAALGQLAASVGHELRNPLAAVRNAATYIARRLSEPKDAPASDPRVGQFLELIDRELAASNRIISDLLDFARERPPALQPCPLRPLVDESLGLVATELVKLVNEVPDALPVPALDKDQFRQVLVNLVQNAVEAIPADRDGVVTVRAESADGARFRLTISDNGQGMSDDVPARIFEPLYTTKTRGTGLGLAVVANLVRGHNGTIRVESAPGQGTTFVLEWATSAARRAA